MAGEIPNLVASARTGTGKGAARQARRDNMVPGVVYGGGYEGPTSCLSLSTDRVRQSNGIASSFSRANSKTLKIKPKWTALEEKTPLRESKKK